MALSGSVPVITFGPITRAMLALYAGASGDHNAIHIDSDFARAAGQPDVFAHGMLSFGILARVATDFAGTSALRSFQAKFVSITQLGDVVTCTGCVTGRFEVDGETRISIELEAHAQDGRTTLTGTAVIAEG